MKNRKNILLVVVIFLMTTSFNLNQSVEFFSPIGELIKDVEAGFYEHVEDIEYECTLNTNFRRVNVKTYDCIKQFVYILKTNYSTLKENKGNFINQCQFELWHHNEISFLHRFRLF
ncbi:MAG: hypothetical protein M9916_10950 [Crocinitomicaceae bacterium]|nr:hypothetical protein [Crocinitomicaceae bacterium]